jgi:MoxR-like ATPase
MAQARLSEPDREFFATLGDVVFGNPYSAQRAALIQRLVPGIPAEALARDREALAHVVAPRLERWLRDGALAGLTAQDRTLLEPAQTYVCYQRHVPALDAHIERQAAAAGTPLPVAFGDDVIGDLHRSGFREARAVRALGLFFQLRRAFFFIERSLTGACDSMRRLREALWNSVLTHDLRGYEAALIGRMEDFSTLILGETGTGKGSAAAAIGRSEFIPYLPEQHRFAANFADGFIAINLSQFPETLAESELFGHRKGAFTGAIEHHDGVFARCSAHGALFLDEIGEVPVPVQIKLLQVLQDRTFTPVGGRELKRFSGRVIAATNRPLAELRREGRFRDDFFYRLCSDVIHVPTLRQRIAESPRELEQLARQLVARIAGEAAQEAVAPVLEALASDVPRDYAWPGNVRELEQAVRRILLTGRCVMEGGAVDPERSLVDRLQAGECTAEALLVQYCAMLYRRFGTYAEVARRTGLDARTARKHIDTAARR